MKGFLNASVLIGKDIIVTNVGIENGKIVAIGSDIEISQPFEIPNSAIVLPGFIDQHVHGAGGSDAMDKNASAIATISKSLAMEGTTSFLATTMTQSPENIKGALSAVKDYINLNDSQGARVLGVHLEGPFISPKFVGAQPLEYVQAPNVETFKEYEKASGNNIKIVSLAPEIDGAKELIKYLKERNIVPSIGHTGAKYSDIEKGIEYGLSNVTHTYNAQTALHHREVGVVGSAMLFDELNAEIICDTIHVCPPAIRLLVKNKPHTKVTLITDAMRAKNLPDGESELGGQKVFVKNGEARLLDGTLAGSVLKMNIAIKNMVEKVGVNLVDAFSFATINPAKNLGVDKEYGSIEVGKRADFAVLDDDYNVLLTVRDGNIIYKA